MLAIARAGPADARPDGGGDERRAGWPVAYRPVTLDELAAGIRSAGAGDRVVRDTTDVFAAHAGGIYDADWAVAQLGPTDFATWCRTVLRSRAQAHPAWS